MRTITDHKLNGLNDAIEITVLDEPGSGNANHEYLITLLNSKPIENGDSSGTKISFQNGPIKETGFNGLSNEALIAVVIDRLRGFQGGQYACRENALALTHFEEGLGWLMYRTRQRLVRGVEGTNIK